MAGEAITRVYKAWILDVGSRENWIGWWKWSGGMAFIWWGVGMLVVVAKENS